MSSGHQRITWRRNITETFNRLSRVHERYGTDRQTDRRQTDGRRHIANVNMSSRSLKTGVIVDGSFTLRECEFSTFLVAPVTLTLTQ